jgi:hypothetical protein
MEAVRPSEVMGCLSRKRPAEEEHGESDDTWFLPVNQSTLGRTPSTTKNTGRTNDSSEETILLLKPAPASRRAGPAGRRLMVQHNPVMTGRDGMPYRNRHHHRSKTLPP